MQRNCVSHTVYTLNGRNGLIALRLAAMVTSHAIEASLHLQNTVGRVTVNWKNGNCAELESVLIVRFVS